MSVVIATLHRPATLARALASLADCQPPPDEVIVVDGDPARSAEAPAAEAALPVRYLQSPVGTTLQRNRGIDAASGEVVLFLDDDVQVAPELLAYVAAAYDDPSVVGVTGRVIEPGDHAVVGKRSALRRWVLGGRTDGAFTRYGYPRRVIDADAPRDVEVMQGCFMSARTDAARQVRFDEHLPGYGLAEDEDFSYRLSRRGRIRFLPDAVVHHHNTGFSSRDRRAFGRQVVVNRAYLFRKNFPQTPLARAEFAMLVAALLAHRALNRDWQGLQGLLDGVTATWGRRR